MKTKIMAIIIALLALASIVYATHQTSNYRVTFIGKDSLASITDTVVYPCVSATSANNAMAAKLPTFDAEFGHKHLVLQSSAMKSNIGC